MADWWAPINPIRCQNSEGNGFLGVDRQSESVAGLNRNGCECSGETGHQDGFRLPPPLTTTRATGKIGLTKRW